MLGDNEAIVWKRVSQADYNMLTALPDVNPTDSPANPDDVLFVDQAGRAICKTRDGMYFMRRKLCVT